MPSSTPLLPIVDAAAAFDDPPPTPLVVGESVTRTNHFTPDAVSAFSSSMGDTNPLHRMRDPTSVVCVAATGRVLLGFK